MTWLKLDDVYDSHPKLLELSEVQRWRWTRALLYCARHKTAGRISRSVLRELGCNVPRLLELELLDDVDGALEVHDFETWNPPRDPTATERQRRHRAKTQRDDTVTVTRDDTVTNRDSDGRMTEPRAQPRTRVPAPPRPTTSNDVDDDGLELERQAAAAGWNAKQLASGRDDPPRALAWLAASSSASRPAAFAWSGFAGGGWPDGTTSTARVDVERAASAWLESRAWDETFDELAVTEELERIARRASVAGELDMAGALAYWRELRADRYPEEDKAA